MMRSRKSLWILVLTMAVLVSGVSATYPRPPSAATEPQSPGADCEYFTETGHWVCDEFLDYFETRGGLEIFGYPLTEAYVDARLGLKVQYFQRARMEWHPGNPDPYKVLLGLLADELGYDAKFPPARPEQIPALNNNLHHYFPETRHVVSYAFLDYFREHGGIDIFGYPRSEFMVEGGLIVQYFQRARMEWHPENPPGSQMLLTNLVEEYLDRFLIPEGVLKPVGEGGAGLIDTSVTRLDVSASVRNVITGRQGVQTVFVYVTDQRQQPVEGANVKMVVHYPSGDQTYDRFNPTNASGFTHFSFDILPAPPGRKVVIDITVTYQGLTSTTQAFFLPWW